MLRITADVFSGRPNPSWIVENDKDILLVLREAVKTRELVTAQAAELGGLGELRGFFMDIASDELAADHGLSSSLYRANYQMR